MVLERASMKTKYILSLAVALGIAMQTEALASIHPPTPYSRPGGSFQQQLASNEDYLFGVFATGAPFFQLVTQSNANKTALGTNTTNIANNTTAVTTNVGTIKTNTTNIGNNTTAATDNATSIKTNTTDVGNNTKDITTNAGTIGSNTGLINTNTQAVSVNNDAVSKMQTMVNTTLPNKITSSVNSLNGSKNYGSPSSMIYASNTYHYISVPADQDNHTLSKVLNSPQKNCAGGCTIKLGPGIYKLTKAITIPSNVTLEGSGEYTTILQSNLVSKPAALITVGNNATLSQLTIEPAAGSKSVPKTLIKFNPVAGGAAVLNSVNIKDFGAITSVLDFALQSSYARSAGGPANIVLDSVAAVNTNSDTYFFGSGFYKKSSVLTITLNRDIIATQKLSPLEKGSFLPLSIFGANFTLVQNDCTGIDKSLSSAFTFFCNTNKKIPMGIQMEIQQLQNSGNRFVHV